MFRHKAGHERTREMNHLVQSVRYVEMGVVGEEVKDEYFHDVISSAAMLLAHRPGNARNAVATAAIRANRQADKKT
jgi:hypothetical protein